MCFYLSNFYAVKRTQNNVTELNLFRPQLLFSFSPGNCTFDEGMCEWINDKSDDFDWQLIEGGTPSEGTGPKAGYKGEGQQLLLNTLTVLPRGRSTFFLPTSPLLLGGLSIFNVILRSKEFI